MPHPASSLRSQLTPSLGQELTARYTHPTSHWTANVLGKVTRVSEDGQHFELDCRYTGRGLVAWFSVDQIVCLGAEPQSPEHVAFGREVMCRDDERRARESQLRSELTAAREQGTDSAVIRRLERQLEIAELAE